MSDLDHKINVAKILLSKNKFEDAEIVFNQILKIDPMFFKAYINIGVICIKQNRLKEAENNFKKAIEINPNFEIAYFNLGTAQEKLEKIEEAKMSFQKAIEIKPDYAEAYINLGTLYIGISNFEDAEKILKKAIKIKPDYSKSYYNLGLAQSLMDKEDLAEINYKKALECDPRFTDAYNNLLKIQKEKKLLSNIEKNKNLKKNKINKNYILLRDTYISSRRVEENLISELYKIKTKELDKSKDPRYGNGIYSDYELFSNNSNVLKTVEKDLTKIMSEAVNSDIFIIESFFNILRQDSGLKIHTHLNKFDEKHDLIDQKYSLTYYLSVGDQKCSEPGVLKLYDPLEEILPSAGSIAIFPATRKHSVVYNGKTERVMIGINFYALT